LVSKWKEIVRKVLVGLGKAAVPLGLETEKVTYKENHQDRSQTTGKGV